MKVVQDKGITLIALAITIVVMIILAGVTISSGLIGTDSTKVHAEVSELNMVSHAILQRYTKAGLTKEQLPGEKTKDADMQTMKNVINQKNITINGNREDYYTLTEESLKKLGISNSTDTYIVNYKTGEAFNLTKQKTSAGNILYISSEGNTF